MNKKLSIILTLVVFIIVSNNAKALACGGIISPNPATVCTGESQQFIAVTEECFDPCYTWSISSQGAEGSSIDNNGLYTAGREVGTDIIKLTVGEYDDEYGCDIRSSDTAVVNVIGGAPVASFTYSPKNPEVGEEITFDASDSYSPCAGVILEYHWNFGDGNGAEGEVATHSFTFAGEYSVNLSLTDYPVGRYGDTYVTIVVGSSTTTTTFSQPEVTITTYKDELLLLRPSQDSPTETFTATANQSGGSYFWGVIPRNAQIVSGQGTDTVEIRAIEPSDSNLDTTVWVTYTLNGLSADAYHDITILKPHSLEVSRIYPCQSPQHKLYECEIEFQTKSQFNADLQYSGMKVIEASVFEWIISSDVRDLIIWLPLIVLCSYGTGDYVIAGVCNAQTNSDGKFDDVMSLLDVPCNSDLISRIDGYTQVRNQRICVGGWLVDRRRQYYEAEKAWSGSIYDAVTNVNIPCPWYVEIGHLYNCE